MRPLRSSICALRVHYLALVLLSVLWMPTVPAAHAGGADLQAIRRLLRDPEPSARAAALRRLAGEESRGAFTLLIGGLADRHPYVRRAAAGVLGQVLSVENRRVLSRRLLRHRDDGVRREACRAYVLWADLEGRRALDGALKDRVPAVREEALRLQVELLHDMDLELIAKLGDPFLPGPSEMAARAVRLLDDADGRVRARALDLLRLLGPAGLDPARWPGFLRDEEARVRLVVLESSVAVAGDTAVVAVLHGLSDAVWSVRLAAAELAGTVEDRRVLEALPALLEDERARVREAAHASLMALTGIPFDPRPARWLEWLAGDGRDFDPRTRTDERKRPRRSGTDTVVAVRFLDLPITSRHVAFVLDASGSMKEPSGPGGERRWDVVCRALLGALDAMRAESATRGRAYVNVHCFATKVEGLFDQARALDAATRTKVARWLEDREPGGRTALYDGIAAGLSDPSIDTVIVLSDGAPSAGSFFTKTDLLGALREENRWRRARIDVIAVGTDRIAARWRDVLKRIAKESGGRFVKK